MADEVELDYEEEELSDLDANNLSQQQGPPAAALMRLQQQQTQQQHVDEQMFSLDLAAPPNNPQQQQAQARKIAPPLAHSPGHKVRFEDFILRPELIRAGAIHEVGFEDPSDVPIHCIPHAIMGFDLLCQAKSGTGKSAVFIISTLQQLNVEQVAESAKPRILVLCPTRELAFQTAHLYQKFKQHINGARLALFFDGLPIQGDIEKLRRGIVHIIVGTPGRILALVREKALDVSGVGHFVVDECDKMLAAEDMRADVQAIFIATPKQKQVLMFTATLPPAVQDTCRKFMSVPLEVIVEDDAELVLENLLQHYLPVPNKEKVVTLLEFHEHLEFDQMIVFVNTALDCGMLDELLTERGFENITIDSAMTQEERLARYNQFKLFKARILIATDLFGRGMDISLVNAMVNECFKDPTTYLHRIARAGRFEKKGLAVTFVSDMSDMDKIWSPGKEAEAAHLAAGVVEVAGQMGAVEGVIGANGGGGGGGNGGGQGEGGGEEDEEEEEDIPPLTTFSYPNVGQLSVFLLARWEDEPVEMFPENEDGSGDWLVSLELGPGSYYYSYEADEVEEWSDDEPVIFYQGEFVHYLTINPF